MSKQFTESMESRMEHFVEASEVDINRVRESARRVALDAHKRGPSFFVEARAAYVGRLALECLREAFGNSRLCYNELKGRFGFSSVALERGDGDVVERFELPQVHSWEPTLVGWAFQAWGEPVRDQSSWAVSYAAEENAESADIQALTQIFTDGYIADFLARSCRELRQRPAGAQIRICDPGCGTGHLLIAALRDRASRGDLNQLELYGFDIDALAVDLCRTLLFSEHVRLGAARDLGLVWSELASRILSLPAPLGVLDRSISLPAPTFDVVVANPPYLGRRKMPSEVREYLDTHYAATKIDLCAAFLQRSAELLVEGGALGFVASDKWLRLAGYRSFRAGQGAYRGFLRELALSEIVELGARAFSNQSKMHDGVRVAAVIGQKYDPVSSHEVRYRDLSGVLTYADKVSSLARGGVSLGNQIRLPQEQLVDSDASSPFLRASDLPKELITAPRTIADVARVVVGLQTNDDRRFVRYVWEIPPDRSRWKVHSKGSGYCRWYGNNQWILDWEGGKRLFFKSQESLDRAETWISQSGWCYGWFANGTLGLRVKECGWTFGRAATSGVFCDHSETVSFLNSRWASLCVRYIGGKMQIPEGIVRRIPSPHLGGMVSSRLVEAAVRVKRRLVAMDPSDATFQHSSSGLWRDEYVFQALLLLIEGVLESQIERALGVRRDESERLAARYGVPVAWFPQGNRERQDEFWELVPSEYVWLRELVGVECSSHKVRARDVEDLSNAAVFSALQKRGGVSGDPWVLPITSPVERLSRLWGRNPIDAVLALCRGAARNEEIREVLAEPLLFREALSSLLAALDHRWWFEDLNTERVCGATISLKEAARLVLRNPRLGEVWHDREQVVMEWLRGRFSDWHSKLFHQRSPLKERANSSREIFYCHLWDEPARRY